MNKVTTPDAKASPAQSLVQGRLFQFQSAKGNFGEIFEIYDKKNATKICNQYIRKNIEQVKDYITNLKNEENEEKEILNKAIEDIKKTIVYEIKAENNKLIKIRIGKYKE